MALTKEQAKNMANAAKKNLRWYRSIVRLEGKTEDAMVVLNYVKSGRKYLKENGYNKHGHRTLKGLFINR